MQRSIRPSLPSVLQKTGVYQPLDYLQVRAPLLPLEAYLDQHKLSASTLSDLSAYHPLAQQALAVGSIALFEELERQSSSPRDRIRRERKLLRYLIRMATRPTPYGLFAGVSLAFWGEQTNLKMADSPRVLSIRPDMSWLLSLIWKLEALPEIRYHVRYIANTAAYVRRGRIFLLEQLSHGQPRQAEAVSLRATRAALQALRLARQPIAHDDLVKALLSSVPDATSSKVEALLTTLWHHTLLFTDLHPPLTGIEPVQYLQQRLAQIPVAAPLASLLHDFCCALQMWNQVPRERSIERYRALLQQTKAIETAIETLLRSDGRMSTGQEAPKKQQGPSSTVLQVDSAFFLEGKQIARTIGEEVASLAELLLRLSPLPQGFPYLRDYRQSFLSRYGLAREVPLLEVLDSQFGLGIPDFSRNQPRSQHESFPERDQELLRIALTAIHESQQVVILNEENLKHLVTSSPERTSFPFSLDVYVWLAATSSQAFAQGEYQVVLGPAIGAHQAGRSLGRFASLLGEEACQVLKQTAQQEAQCVSQVLLAELVYLHHDPRTANVALRPAVRSHEVLYGVVPGSETIQIIPLDELMLGVRHERFYVRWPARNVEVLFCAGHMLSASRASALIRFLSELSYDGLPLLSGFHWGPCTHFPFLPRIQVGRTVLSLAQWSINSTFHLNELLEEPPARFQEALLRWRKRWHVPRYVYLCEGDNRLLLDLERSEQIEEFFTVLRQLKKTQTIALQEALPGPEHAWLEGPAGHYASEYVISLIRNQSMVLSEMRSFHSRIPEQPEPENGMRLKCLGSEWLFMKLYCAPTQQENLLAGPVRTFVKNILAQRLAENWFFIRYADPDPHIRLRFQGDPQVLISQLLPLLCTWAAALVSDGPCLKFAFDGYEREIERYGGQQGLFAAEILFGADSLAVVDLLHLKQTQALKLDLQTLAVLTVDDILASLGLLPLARLQWYSSNVPSVKATGVIYRQKGAELRALLTDRHSIQHFRGGEQLGAILATRSTRLACVQQQISEALIQQTLNQQPEQIYRSFLHMHCNRLLGIDLEAEQQVLELLLRTWKGLLQAEQ